MGNINESLKLKEVLQMSPICNKCKNHIDGLTCRAFIIIPDEIIFGKNNHSKPLPNQDNDIVFESIDND